MMVNLMRANQRWLMIVVSVLVLISFLWYFSNTTRIERLGTDRAGTIYGRTVSSSELQRAGRQVQTAYDLRLAHVLAPELRQVQSDNEFIVNQYVMQHQAEAYGINPTKEEIDEAGQKNPAFFGPDGKFNPELVDQFVANKLNPRGFNGEQLDELVRRDLQFAKLHDLVVSTVVVTPAEVRTAYEMNHSQTEASVVRFKTADFQAVAEPTEDDIKKTYDAQKDQYQQPERRKVQYVRFALDDAQKKLQGKERMDVLTPLRDQAEQFLVKLNDAKGKEDFAAVAKAANVPVKETPEFEESQTTGFEEAAIPGFVNAAFELSIQDPDSNVPLRTPPQASDAFYVLHLSGLVPVRPLTMDEARPKIITALKEEHTREALSAKAEEARAKISEAVKAGKSFADAAKEAGLTVQDLPGFTRESQPELNAAPDESQIHSACAELRVGELSKFLPTADGGALVFVRGRSGVDAAAYEKAKDGLTLQTKQFKARVVFEQWLRASREAADARLTTQLRNL